MSQKDNFIKSPCHHEQGLTDIVLLFLDDQQERGITLPEEDTAGNNISHVK